MLIVAGPSGLHGHDGGPLHPEQPARIRSAMEGVADLGLGDEIVYTAIAPASDEDLARVHTRGYLDELMRRCRLGGGDLDADTYLRPDSYDVARRTAGAGLEAIRALEERGEGVAFVAGRPPGHHALADRAMGFCLLNNVAVAAASLTARGQRVLIVDWDVHHGNGTQEIFWDSDDVLFVSAHQWPLYPGTGRAGEVGGTHAIGLTVNVPLPEGATGDVVRAGLELLAAPVVDRFKPDWVLVSCGFDAHRSDPIGGLSLTSGDFGAMARLVRAMAPRDGRLALFLEGGYSASAIRESVAVTLGTLLDRGTEGEAQTFGGPGTEAVRAAQSDRELALRATEEQATRMP